MLEAQVLKDVGKLLDLHEFHRTVVWYERLNSGKVKVFGNWIKLCREGTSDYVAIIRNRDNSLTLLFIECKRGDGKGYLRPAQEEFRDRYSSEKDVLYVLVNDALHLRELLNRMTIDKTQYLPDTIGM